MSGRFYFLSSRRKLNFTSIPSSDGPWGSEPISAPVHVSFIFDTICAVFNPPGTHSVPSRSRRSRADARRLWPHTRRGRRPRRAPLRAPRRNGSSSGDGRSRSRRRHRPLRLRRTGAACPRRVSGTASACRTSARGPSIAGKVRGRPAPLPCRARARRPGTPRAFYLQRQFEEIKKSPVLRIYIPELNRDYRDGLVTRNFVWGGI